MFILGMIVGSIAGLIIFVLIAGATTNNREHDAYVQGYEDGKKAGGK